MRVRDGEIIIGRKSRFQNAVETEERIYIGGNKHRIEVFADGSATEFFVDDVAAVSVRMYRNHKPNKLLSVKEGKVLNVCAFTMRAAEIKGE